jgi:hypothetical protein
MISMHSRFYEKLHDRTDGMYGVMREGGLWGSRVRRDGLQREFRRGGLAEVDGVCVLRDHGGDVVRAVIESVLQNLHKYSVPIV